MPTVTLFHNSVCSAKWAMFNPQPYHMYMYHTECTFTLKKRWGGGFFVCILTWAQVLCQSSVCSLEKSLKSSRGMENMCCVWTAPYNHTTQQQTLVPTAVTSDLWAQSIISFIKMPNTNQFRQEMTFYFWKHKLTSIPFLHQSPLTTIQERLITKSTMKGFECGNNGTSVCRARCAIQLLVSKQRRACPATACDASKHIKMCDSMRTLTFSHLFQFVQHPPLLSTMRISVPIILFVAVAGFHSGKITIYYYTFVLTSV